MRCIHWPCIAKSVDPPPYCFSACNLTPVIMTTSAICTSLLALLTPEMDAGLDLLPPFPYIHGIEAVGAGLLCSSVSLSIDLFSSSPDECKFV